jgi:hypothetical protein
MLLLLLWVHALKGLHKVMQASVPASESRFDGSEARSEPTLQDRTCKSHARSPSASLAGEKLVDVIGDRLVKIHLPQRKFERLRNSMTPREQRLPVEVSELFFDSSGKPGIVRLLNHVTIYLKADELVLVEEAQKVGELINVALVWRRRQKEESVALA